MLLAQKMLCQSIPLECFMHGFVRMGSFLPKMFVLSMVQTWTIRKHKSGNQSINQSEHHKQVSESHLLSHRDSFLKICWPVPPSTTHHQTTYGTADLWMPVPPPGPWDQSIHWAQPGFRRARMPGMLIPILATNLQPSPSSTVDPQTLHSPPLKLNEQITLT